ncbi:MAG: nitrophenyl compound nitroreductase subunit ArsF family protein [Dehalococcoidia bacterium]|jgi:hypothetical protein
MGISSKIRLVALTAVLLLTIGLVSACKVPEPDNSSGPPPSIDNGVEVVYFHRAQRCIGCTRLQEMTEYTLNTCFDNEMESSEIVFMALNLQDSANADMVQKFGAYTSSLFLNDVENGTNDIEEMTDIWFVLWKDEAFVNTLEAEIEARLN